MMTMKAVATKIITVTVKIAIVMSRDGDGGGNSSDDSDSEGSNSEDYGSRDSGDDRGEPLSDKEGEDAGAFYEDNSYDEVDYYDENIEDDA